LKYLDNPRISSMIIVFLLFTLSCLSKAMAVSFVPVLFLIDYLQKRKFTVKTILEKTPFIILALVIGYHAVVVQSKEAMNEFSTFTITQRFMFASYGFMMYLSKLFVPFNLSAFYPYPNVNDLGNIPSIFYISPFVVLGIIGLPIFLLWKFKKELLPVFIFGMGFFIATIVLVLQFISVGSAIMADRYSYIPYIGIFFMVSTISYELIKNKKIIIAAGIAISLIFAYLCYQRVQVWHNTETLWTDVIEKYPYRVEVAYKNRGNYYAQNQKLDEAYKDHETLIYKMHSQDAGVYVNFANICGLKKDFNKSLEAYSKALEVKKTDNFDIYLNRAITYSMMQQFDKALADFDTAASKKPDDDKLIQNRSFVYLQVKQYDKAIADYNVLIERFPEVKDYPFNRGLANFNKGMYQEAIADFSNSLKLQPDYKEAYFNISVAYKQLGRFKESLSYAEKAKSLGHPVTDAYLNELKSKSS
jgi:tetratricopeptide (TPR) repeat protein